MPLKDDHPYSTLFVKFHPDRLEQWLIKYVADKYGWLLECDDTFYERKTEMSSTKWDADRPLRIYVAIMPQSVEAVCSFLNLHAIRLATQYALTIKELEKQLTVCETKAGFSAETLLDNKYEPSIFKYLNEAVYSATKSSWHLQAAEPSSNNPKKCILYKKFIEVEIPPFEELCKAYRKIFKKMQQGWQEQDIATTTEVPLSPYSTYHKLFIKYNPLKYELLLLEYIAGKYAWQMECDSGFYNQCGDIERIEAKKSGRPLRIWLAMAQKNCAEVCSFLNLPF